MRAILVSSFLLVALYSSYCQVNVSLSVASSHYVFAPLLSSTYGLHSNRPTQTRFNYSSVKDFYSSGITPNSLSTSLPLLALSYLGKVKQTTAVTYTIAATTTAGGSINPTGNVPVDEGSSKTFSISTSAGYKISDVLIDGVSVGKPNTYIFTNVTQNHTIHVVFEERTQTIMASAGSGGAISPSGNLIIKEGSSQTFTITPSAGYAIDDVKVDNVSAGKPTTYTFNNIIANHTISVTFKPISNNTYTISATTGTGGTISPSGNVTVVQNGDQSFTINPGSGYQIDDVEVDNVSKGSISSYNFQNVTANHTIYVTFKSTVTPSFTITSSAGTGGTISPSGSVSILQGANQTYTITASAGYQIDDVKVDNVSKGSLSTYTFQNVTGDHTIQSTFKTIVTPSFTINASAGTGGTISPNGSVSILQGANQAFTITASSGYQIEDVKVDNVSKGLLSTYTFQNVTTNHTINATFKAIPSFNITASSGTGGSISPSGSVSVQQGTNKSFAITANSGFQIDDVKVDNVSKGSLSTYTFQNVTASHTINATFKVTTTPSFTIVASAGTGGTISPSGSLNVVKGANQTFIVSPSTGYAIDDVLIDNLSAGKTGTYTFSSIQGDHTIVASFILTETITGLEDWQEKIWRIYPNPVDDQQDLTIEIQQAGTVSIELMNVCGMKIEEIRIEVPNHEIPYGVKLRSLSAGIYFIRMTKEDKTFIRRVLKL